MKQFKIFSHPHAGYEAVKQGWSWPAFFFGAIWALVKKMWAIGTSVLVAGFLFGFLLGVIGTNSGTPAGIFTHIASIVVAIIFGINGNKWREDNLPKRGYEYKDVILADNADAAVALFVKGGSSPATQAADANPLQPSRSEQA